MLGPVCVFYTSVGGMKAVVWTDVFQMAVIVAGVVAIISVGAWEVGGLGEVFRISGENGRLVFFK